jgi:hypothetical protein
LGKTIGQGNLADGPYRQVTAADSLVEKFIRPLSVEL